MKLALFLVLAIPLAAQDQPHKNWIVFPGGCQELRNAWLDERSTNLTRATYNSLIVTETGWRSAMGQTGSLLFEPAEEGYSCKVTAAGGPALRILRHFGAKR
jgi:hypothetical protein